MAPLSVVFLGSFQHYSALVLAALVKNPTIQVVAVVTTPPALHSRSKKLVPNPVQQLAEEHALPVFTPDFLSSSTLDDLQQHCPHPDILLTAGYGKLLPTSWLSWPLIAALNLHFSLLPKYRGANPAEWALLRGESETGVTVIEMSTEFDTGHIVAQASQPLSSNDTRETVYETLYTTGGAVLPSILATYVRWKRTGQPLVTPTNQDIKYFIPPQPQGDSPTPYAKRLQRQDGYIAWEDLQLLRAGKPLDKNALSSTIHSCLENNHVSPLFIERMTRALAGFPSVWTEIPTAKGKKRMKILTVDVQDTHLQLHRVQIEGQQPALWNQVKNQIQE